MNADVYDLLKNVYGFSDRIARVVACKANGHENAIICEKLSVSVGAINHSMKMVKAKFEAATEGQLFFQIGMKIG